jgi:hypothetical protein
MKYTKEFKGKTIKDIKIFCDERSIGIFFDDDTWTAFCASMHYKDVEVEHSVSADYDVCDLKNLGVMSEEEFEKAKAEEAKQRKAIVKERELNQYNRIKEKYNL